MGATPMSLEGVEVGEDQDVGFLGPYRLPGVEVATGQIGEGVGPPLPGGPGIVWGRGGAWRRRRR